MLSPALSPAQEFDDLLPGGEVEYLEAEEFRISFSSEIFAVLIDARIRREYRRERIDGAVNIPGVKQLMAFADTMDSETPVYIYCDGEARSRSVVELLTERGFSRIRVLRHGILGWKAAGLPVKLRRSKPAFYRSQAGYRSS